MRLRDPIQSVWSEDIVQLRVALGVALDSDLDCILEVLATQNRPALLFHRRQSRPLSNYPKTPVVLM